MARRLLREVGAAALSDWRPRSARYALAGTFGVLFVLLVADGRALFQPAPFPNDLHANMSLALALSERYCGRQGVLNSQHLIGQAISGNDALLSRDFPSLIQSQAGSLQQYCAGLDYPFLNNENSLLLVMRAGLFLSPHPSPARLGQFLTVVRLLLVVGFAYVLLRVGSGWPFAIFSSLAICRVLVRLHPFEYSMYAFFIPLLVGMAAFYAISLTPLKSKSIAWQCAFSAGAGFLTAFCANMRSSHLPVYVAMFLVFAGAVARAPRMAARGVVLILSFVCGYALFGPVFISPLRPASLLEPNYTHHVIAHPLVLGLAIPESALSRREGIEWNDPTGLQLARRMVPDAVYLGRGYEEGLILYYLKLWLQYPAEMRQVYRAKFAMAGTPLFQIAGWNPTHPKLWNALEVVLPLRTGFTLLALYILAALGALVWFGRRGVPAALLWLLLSIVAVALLIESAVIMPWFYLQYHGYLLVYSAIAAAFVIELIARRLLRVDRWVRT